MGAIKEFHDFWLSLSKAMRVIFLILLLSFFLIVTIFFSIVCWKAFKGEPIKLFGIEVNEHNKTDTNNIKPRDTSKYQIGIKSIVKVDKMNSSISTNNQKSGVLRYSNKSQNSNLIKKDTLKTPPIQNFEFRAPIQAPSQFGNGNTQVNQITGKIDRHPDEGLVNSIFSYLPNKKNDITIAYETPDVESKNFSNELKNILEKIGYKKVTLFGHLEIGTPQQAFPISVDTVHYSISVELNGH